MSSGPAIAAQGQVIEVVTVVTNHGPSAVSSFVVDIPHPEGTRYAGNATTSGECYLSGLEFCAMGILGAGQSATIRHQLEVTGAAGTTIQYTASARHWTSPLVDPNPANDTSSVSFAVVVPAAVPGLSPLSLAALAVLLAIAGFWVQRV